MHQKTRFFTTRRNTNSRHTFIFITQSSRSWNKFLMKRYQRREIAAWKVLLSLTVQADKPHVALIVVGFDWKMLLFSFFSSRFVVADKFYICLCNELCAATSKTFQPCNDHCAHKFSTTQSRVKFSASIELAHFCHRRCRLKVLSARCDLNSYLSLI